MRKVVIAAAVILVMLATPGLADLASRYSISGHFGDSDYYGAIDFKPSGQVYHSVNISGDDKTPGLAVEYENFLALAQIDSNGSGNLAIYHRQGDAWVGTYTDYDKGLGFEVLFGRDPPGLPDAGRAKLGKLAGKYRLSGRNPDGSIYAGEAEVTFYGATFDVDRAAGKEGMTGTAVAFDGAFVLNVSNSDGRAPIGVLGLFIPDGNGFLGVWAKAGTDRLGAERWVRE
jgi:hypothetical protein